MVNNEVVTGIEPFPPDNSAHSAATTGDGANESNIMPMKTSPGGIANKLPRKMPINGNIIKFDSESTSTIPGFLAILVKSPILCSTTRQKTSMASRYGTKLEKISNCGNENPINTHSMVKNP